ncbi:hypothetical protein [Luteimonas lutimaris]|nr:hypothetical protein [Luteimonas sp.]
MGTGEPQAPGPEASHGRDWNAVAAVIAALIGLLALAVSGYTAWLQRQQVRAEVWPYLQPGISPSQHNMNLSNKGVGPASVQRVTLYVDGRPQRDWPHAFDALGLPELRDTAASTINGIVLSPGETIQQITLRDADAFARFYRQYPRIQLRLCYCSALGECWIYDERERSADTRRQAIAACPAIGADEFIDNRLRPARPPA